MTGQPEDKYPLTYKAMAMADEIAAIRLSIQADTLKDPWQRVAYYNYVRSWRTLNAFSIIMKHGAVGPAKILLRHMFELAVVTRYLNKHRAKVDNFIQYCQVYPMPSRTWRPVKMMCKDLGLLKEYDSMYRILSEEAHGGVFGMDAEYLRLMQYEEMPDWDSANVALSAMGCHTLIMAVYHPEPDDQFHDWEERLSGLGKAIISAAEVAAKSSASEKTTDVG